MVPVYVFDCVYCKNVRKDDKYRLICGAYPKGFPEEIVHSIIKPHELKECGNESVSYTHLTLPTIRLV